MPGDLDAIPQESAGEPAAPEQITRLLNAATAGDVTARNQLFALVYDQLRAIARRRMAAAQPGDTLQATALVNEACIRLLRRPDAGWENRGHFFAAAAQAMRQILVDQARARKADKRGGGRAALSIRSVADLTDNSDPSGILALDDAICRLERVDAFAASVVRLRFYAGLESADVAGALGASERTARRAWTFARGWLRDALEHDAD